MTVIFMFQMPEDSFVLILYTFSFLLYYVYFCYIIILANSF